MNLSQVSQVDKNLTINDMRSAELYPSDRKIWIYWRLPYLGKSTGFKGVRRLTIKQMENLIARLQAAVDLAYAYEREHKLNLKKP